MPCQPPLSSTKDTDYFRVRSLPCSACLSPFRILTIGVAPSLVGLAPFSGLLSSVKFETVNPEYANILNPSSPNYTAWHAVAMLAQLCSRGTPRPRLSPYKRRASDRPAI